MTSIADRTAIPTADEVDRAYRRSWFPIVSAADLAYGPREASLLGERLVVFRGQDGQVAVLPHRCPHRGGPLSLGKVVGTSIECPYHGWRWRGSDGRCIAIPAIGEDGPIPNRAVTRTYPVCEMYGLIWTASETPAGDPPIWSELSSEPEFVAGGPIPTRAGLRATVENFRDVAHFPFVHEKSMGKINPQIEPLDVERNGFSVCLNRKYSAYGGNEHFWHDMHYTYHVVPPGFVCVRTRSQEGTRYLLHAPCPRADGHTDIFYAVATDEGYRGPSLSEWVNSEAVIYAEDIPILDELEPLECPLDADSAFHSPADKYTLAYRQAFVDWVADLNAAPD